jgi:hypothetical protein
MTKVYIFSTGTFGGLDSPDLSGCALAEDGTVLGNHISSSMDWLHHDLQRPYHVAAYEKHYPDGYEIVLGEPPAEVLDRAGFVKKDA